MTLWFLCVFQIVSIVGGSGSGKSTLGALLSRMYDTTAGSIKIDGAWVSDIRVAKSPLMECDGRCLHPRRVEAMFLLLVFFAFPPPMFWCVGQVLTSRSWIRSGYVAPWAWWHR